MWLQKSQVLFTKEGCTGLAYLGIRLDPRRNTMHADRISLPQSPGTVRVIPTNEDLVIARHTRALIFPLDATSS